MISSTETDIMQVQIQININSTQEKGNLTINLKKTILGLMFPLLSKLICNPEYVAFPAFRILSFIKNGSGPDCRSVLRGYLCMQVQQTAKIITAEQKTH